MLQVAERARYQPDEKLKAISRLHRPQHARRLRPRAPPAGTATASSSSPSTTTPSPTSAATSKPSSEKTDRPEGRLAIFKGSTSLEERQEIKEAFNADPAEHPVRILLATDAAREGLNLQKHCADLFHYDVPWNPARLEQRNGRIDRKLQPAPVVHCRYFLYENRKEDAILAKLVAKTERIYRELGGFGTVLDKRLIDRFRRRGIERARLQETLDLFDRQDPEEEQLAARARAEVSGDDDDAPETNRERIDRKRRERLVKSIERLRDLFEKSRNWLGFRDREFRAALDCSLRLMDVEGGLQPEPTERNRARRYRVPTEALEHNPSWRETLNSLRAPRRRKESLADWYARCPIRPIVFEDPGLSQLGAPIGQAAGPEPVHMHLEHRVSQRLLGRFLAQGFVHHDLSRACLAQSEGSIPLVFLIGRLCLYGHHAARLHEDLVAVCAEWNPPEDRDGGLQPIKPSRLSDEEAMRRLDDALLAGQTHLIPDARRRALLASAPRDVRELLRPLKAPRRSPGSLRPQGPPPGRRGRGREDPQAPGRPPRPHRGHPPPARRRGRRGLAPRPPSARPAPPPALFDLDDRAATADDERIRRERAAERRAMEKRRKDLDREIADEPDRIRARFAVQTVRLEPVGLVYLWPERG